MWEWDIPGGSSLREVLNLCELLVQKLHWGFMVRIWEGCPYGPGWGKGGVVILKSTHILCPNKSLVSRGKGFTTGQACNLNPSSEKGSCSNSSLPVSLREQKCQQGTRRWGNRDTAVRERGRRMGGIKSYIPGGGTAILVKVSPLRPKLTKRLRLNKKIIARPSPLHILEHQQDSNIITVDYSGKTHSYSWRFQHRSVSNWKIKQAENQ